jgi:hypothetical protein
VEPVRVEAPDANETDDLLEALSVRGLEARRVGAAEVEVEAADEEAWNLEIVAAIEAWLEESDHEAVVARQGKHTFTVKAPDRRVPAAVAPPDQEDAGRGTVGVVAVTIGALALVALAIWLLVSALAG